MREKKRWSNHTGFRRRDSAEAPHRLRTSTQVDVVFVDHIVGKMGGLENVEDAPHVTFAETEDGLEQR